MRRHEEVQLAKAGALRHSAAALAFHALPLAATCISEPARAVCALLGKREGTNSSSKGGLHNKGGSKAQATGVMLTHRSTTMSQAYLRARVDAAAP